MVTSSAKIAEIQDERAKAMPNHTLSGTTLQAPARPSP
jgi:hypothetical protein